MLKVSELADEVQLTADTIRYAIATGELVGFKFGNAWRIRRKDADEWIESHRVTGAAARQRVALRHADPAETAFGKVARQVEDAGRLAEVPNVHHKEAC